MEQIDLTLRGEFSKDSSRSFDDTRQYEVNLGYKDQGSAKKRILNKKESFFFDFDIYYVEIQHEEFFRFKNQKNNEEHWQSQEAIERITGILTKELKMEYACGFGEENVCDCCGSFVSPILNRCKSWLCEKCEKGYFMDNNKFWNKPERFEEEWID